MKKHTLNKQIYPFENLEYQLNDEGLYLNPTQCLPWNKHIQSGYCSCILCLKFIRLYYNELTENKTEEELYLKVW